MWQAAVWAGNAVPIFHISGINEGSQDKREGIPRPIQLATTDDSGNRYHPARCMTAISNPPKALFFMFIAVFDAASLNPSLGKIGGFTLSLLQFPFKGFRRAVGEDLLELP